MPAAEPRPKVWTSEEYYRLAAAGAFEGQRVQLVEGGIIERSPQSGPHAAVIEMVVAALQRVLPAGLAVRVQAPLDLGAPSQPEPDVAVVSGPPRDRIRGHPKKAVLVVEVSDTTLRYDRREKASLYAKARIPEYWVLNLVDNRLEVHRDPGPNADAPFEHGYRRVVPLAPGESVRPPGAAADVPVAELLP